MKSFRHLEDEMLVRGDLVMGIRLILMIEIPLYNERGMMEKKHAIELLCGFLIASSILMYRAHNMASTSRKILTLSNVQGFTNRDVAAHTVSRLCAKDAHEVMSN